MRKGVSPSMFINLNVWLQKNRDFGSGYKWVFTGVRDHGI
jgi:hypothetical protein